MAVIGQSKITFGVTTVKLSFMPLNFYDLLAVFASKFLEVSGTTGKCAAKILGAGGFLPLTPF